MKSPFEIQNEFGVSIGVSAIKRVQADAIMHALKVLRSNRTPQLADMELTNLVFELLGEEFKIPRPTEQELREEKEEADIQKGLKL